MNEKYSRTYHLPWSPGTSSDDRIMPNVNHFLGKEVIVTEKLDGENTGMTSSLCHARSLDSKDHPSRHQMKMFHSIFKHEIPDGWKIFGENVYALHSIHYKNLESHFYLFAVYKDDGLCLSWDDTLEFCTLFNLITAPVLYRGIWDENKIKSCWTGKSTASPGDEQEGYVVRVADSFSYFDQDQGIFSKYTAKFVREKHVQTDSHWLEKPVVKNELRKSN